jgi:hypothetical protein
MKPLSKILFGILTAIIAISVSSDKVIDYHTSMVFTVTQNFGIINKVFIPTSKQIADHPEILEWGTIVPNGESTLIISNWRFYGACLFDSDPIKFTYGTTTIHISEYDKVFQGCIPVTIYLKASNKSEIIYRTSWMFD